MLTAGSRTGQLFILRQGVVEVARDGLQIATVSEPGAVFGELALILESLIPPTCAPWSGLNSMSPRRRRCSARTWRHCFTFLRRLPSVSTAANEVIVEIKRELEADKRPGAITNALEKLEKLLSPAGANTPDFYYYSFF